MNILSIIIFFFSFQRLICAQHNSKEENVETWIDNPDIDLPDNLIICSRNSIDRNECIKQSIKAVMPDLKNGYDNLGILPFDPLFVRKVDFEYQQNDLLALITVKDVMVFGLSKADVQHVTSSLTNNSLEIELDIRFPKVLMEGSYKGEGHINDYKFKPRGVFNLTCSNVTNLWKISGLVESRNGENYMKMHSVNVIPTVDYLKLYATGISSDYVLNQFALDFVNTYWPNYYKSMVIETRKSWEPILVEIINQVFNRVPFRRLMT